MKETDIRRILSQLMGQHQIETDAELSRRTNISQATVHRLLAGTTPDPHLSTLQALADFFSVTLDQLVGRQPLEDNESKTKQDLSRDFCIPLIPWEKASEWEAFIKSRTLDNWDEWLRINIVTGKNAYALQVQQHTLGKLFPYKTLLIIDPQRLPQDGDYIILYDKENKSVTLRQIIIDGTNKLLKSPNKIVSIILMNETQHLCCGVILQAHLSYY